MAYLKAKNGPLAGQRLELIEDSTVLGRSPECDIQVEDYAVSRKHAVLHLQDNQFLVEDLKSRNKTYLNDIALGDGKHQLRNGDKIGICDVVFHFYQDFGDSLDDSSMASGLSVLFGDSEPVGGSTIMSKLDVHSSGGQVQLTASPQVTLNALIEITQSLGKALALDEVLPTVLDSLFKIFVQADRAFIGLLDEHGTLVPRWSKARRDDSDETIRISRTIVNHVMDLRQAVLSADAASDQQFDASQSIADFHIRSMMCAPLFATDGSVLGVLQVDTVERNKQFKQEDLEVLASVASQAGIAIDNAKLHEDALKQQQLHRELELANEVQKGFLPNGRPDIEGYEFYDYYKPANQIGGDYFDYLQLTDGRLAIIVADVVGHGVAAALLMAKLSAEARYSLAAEDNAADALKLLNDRMSGLSLDRFVTLVLIVLDPVTHEVTVVNAGHMAPLHRTADGNIIEEGEDISGIPVGIMEGMDYEQFTFKLEPNESVVMYTDGITEAPNAQDELYGDDRVLDLVKQTSGSAEEAGTTLLNDVLTFMGDTEQFDDMCIVAVKRT